MGNFRQILLLWKDGHGGRFPEKRSARMEAFVELFEELKNKGFPKEHFNARAMSEINTLTINPGHLNKTKLKKWARINAEYLETALYKVYSEGADIERSELLAEIPVFEADPVCAIEEEKIEDDDIDENEKPYSEPKTPKIEHFADTVVTTESVNEIDPEMASILGLKIT